MTDIQMGASRADVFSRAWRAVTRPRKPWENPKVQAAISALIRGNSLFMNKKSAGRVLNIGCGPNALPGALNLDYMWEPGVDICCDATKRLPLPDNYSSHAFTEHCLEHVSLEAARASLREMFRVLEPGGYVRVVVPDLEIYVRSYVAFLETGTTDTMPNTHEDNDFDFYSPAMSVNRIMRKFGHQFIYDFATMAEMMRSVGFVEVTKRSFNEGSCRDLLIDAPVRQNESLYVEGRKPIST